MEQEIVEKYSVVVDLVEVKIPYGDTTAIRATVSATENMDNYILLQAVANLVKLYSARYKMSLERAIEEVQNFAIYIKGREAGEKKKAAREDPPVDL